VIPVVMHVLDTTTIIRVNELEHNFEARCYPNPFSDHVIIEYSIREETRIRVEVYDMNGHRINELVNKNATAGKYKAVWDGRDDAGNIVPPGVYYCRLQTGVRNETMKIVLMR